MPGAAGYMMMAGHFSESHVSSGDLNRPRESRGSQPSACFLVTFCTTQKVTSRFPYGKVSRFCEPRFSSPQWRLRTNKIKTFPKGESRFSKPRFSPPKQQLPTNKIKSFAASRQLFPTFCRVQKVGQKTLKLSFRKVFRGFANLDSARRPWRLYTGTPIRCSLPSLRYCSRYSLGDTLIFRLNAREK